MPTDTASLIVLGVGAALLLWLLVSVFKKLFGLALIAALAFGAYLLWTNPGLLNQAMDMVGLR
jgi:NhaP-type Na+/H+ or K+/H+ antiporter